jgi:hypothetical protein
MTTIEDFETHELIETKKTFFLFDNISDSMGWMLPVYFDRTSDLYRVFGTPTKPGVYFESPELPSDGLFEYFVDEPVRYSKDYTTNIIKVLIR